MNTTTTERPVEPVVLCVAPNGARRTHADHAALPITPDEIAKEALACVEAGATVMHLHVRDDADRHSLDVGRYRAAIEAVKDAVGHRLLIQATTEAVGVYGPAEQMEMVRTLRPEATSIAIRELAPLDADVPALADFIGWAREEKVALQYILYSAEEVQRLRGLIEAGRLPERQPNVLFVLGRYTAGQRSQATDLLPFLSEGPDGWPWSVCAFGPTEAQCMAAAIGLGGHVRVGFENNLQRPDGTVASGNSESVANAARLAVHAGRGVASIEVARRVFGVRRSALAAAL